MESDASGGGAGYDTDSRDVAVAGFEAVRGRLRFIGIGNLLLQTKIQDSPCELLLRPCHLPVRNGATWVEHKTYLAHTYDTISGVAKGAVPMEQRYNHCSESCHSRSHVTISGRKTKAERYKR